MQLNNSQNRQSCCSSRTRLLVLLLPLPPDRLSLINLDALIRQTLLPGQHILMPTSGVLQPYGHQAKRLQVLD